MPTHDRRTFVPRAIQYFLRQTYPNRELIVVDDGQDPVRDLIPPDARIQYFQLPKRQPVGEKRNFACERARGEIILHWDDDDWMAEWRIRYQVEELLKARADVCGLERILFLDREGAKAWEYVYGGSRRPWLAGGTLCYTKALWQHNPFPALNVGEDARFVWSGRIKKALALPLTTFYVASIHRRNTSPKRPAGREWRPYPLEQVRRLLADDWGSPDRTHAPRSNPAEHHCRLSVVMPVHTAGVPLLARTLLALAGQTRNPRDFEVVVAADGGDQNGAIAAAVGACEPHLTCRLVESPRGRGDLAHRNHARNAACRAARGELLWVLDADFLLPANAIDHVLIEYDRNRGSGCTPIFSPCLTGLGIDPARWLAVTQASVDKGDARSLRAITDSITVLRNQYSGFAEHYQPGPPSSIAWPRLLEGFPILPKVVWEALGGFDERFVGWGGNKEEFVRRLIAVGREGAIEPRLLRSVLALHQPHAPDPERSNSQQVGLHQKRLRSILKDVAQAAPWWEEQQQRARRALQSPARQRDTATQSVRVGIVALNTPGKGLRRDAETLSWALQQTPLRPETKKQIQVSLFPVDNLHQALEPDPLQTVAVSGGLTFPAAVPPGTPFSDWIRNLDVLIACEVWLPVTFQLVRSLGLRLIFVPNLEWAHLNGDSDAWIRAVRAAEIEVWAKTRQAHEVLSRHGIANQYVAWSIPDVVRRDRHAAETPQPIHFLLNAGMGGWRNRRGVDIALKAFARARRHDARLRLTLHSIRPLGEYDHKAPLGTAGLRLSEGLLPPDEVSHLYDKADVVLYPTRFDGFGISLLESLHAGLPVLCTNGDPMRELVEHDHNGLLVEARKGETIGLTASWDCNVQALAEAMLRLASEPELRRRLTCPEPGALVARQQAFAMRVRTLVCQNSPPRIALFYNETPGDGARASELYWADAFREHGYRVECYGLEGDASVRRKALCSPLEFVLLGKAPANLVRAIRAETAAPVILWHHDLSDATPVRWRWFTEVAALCDLIAIPDDAGARLHGRHAKIVHLLPGAKVDGDRGPGRRPRWRPTQAGGDTVVFLGQPTPERTALLKSLSTRFRLDVYGNAESWQAVGLRCNGPRWGAQAERLIHEAGVVISVSARHDGHYTSNRLFNSAAAGGCVLVREFPGLTTLYPGHAVESYKRPEEIVPKIQALLGDPRRRRAMKLAAEEHTFRHHMWLDRVETLLPYVQSLNRAGVDAQNAAPIRTQQAFWEERASRLNIRSVGHHRWTEAQFREHTEICWMFLAAHIERCREDRDRRLLDFGSGTGRFSSRLVRSGFHVVGVDIAAAMLALARRSQQHDLPLVQVSGGGELPFRARAFDVLWTCFTLQHVPDECFASLVHELRRVIRPGGLVVLLENTYRHSQRTSRSGHMVFRRPAEYEAAFPGVVLTDRMIIEGEEHSLFMGRLTSPEVSGQPDELVLLQAPAFSQAESQ